MYKSSTFSKTVALNKAFSSWVDSDVVRKEESGEIEMNWRAEHRLCHSREPDSLTQGDQLMDYQHLVSAGGIFKLGFFSPGNSKQRYIGIWYSNDSNENIVWVANRDNPISDTYGVLTIDGDGKLKIVHGNETLVVLNSDQTTTNATATLEDTGNFVMREVNSKRVLWQSFDYPTNTLLPGMKLGVNLKTGHRWSLVSWLSSEEPATGAFTLGGDPNGTTQLFMWQRGDLYWTSGAWRNGTFEFFEFVSWNAVHPKYQMEYISDGDEKYFTYSVKDGSKSMWVMEPLGQIADKQGRTTSSIGTSNFCDGYSFDQGCLGPKLPECRNSSKDVFELKYGSINGDPYKIDGNSSLGLSDCKVECTSNCSCVAYTSHYTNDTGCVFWSSGSSIEEYTNGIQMYVLGSHKVAVALVILLLVYLYCLKRKVRLEGEKEASKAMLFSELESNTTTCDNFVDANELDKEGKVISQSCRLIIGYKHIVRERALHCSLMASKKIFLFILLCISMRSYSAVVETNTITQGHQLMDYQHLVSAGGIFKLGFFSPGNSKQRYIGIWYNEGPDYIVWVANRNTPIIDTYGVLTIDADGNLKILHGDETLIVLNSNKATTNATTTLEDNGNFILREVNSKRVLWQSFDYPTNTLLPGMKLGVNLNTGHRWSLVSWLSSEEPATGAFTLGGDPNGTTQLFMWQRGDLYWTSGAWRNGTFEFFEFVSWNAVDPKYQMEYISDGDEKYFT
ncbi:hypothetical protein HHK36_021599 [Tetracentron sinense]|uniref:non-specific serine/threonine protein kinase n=1 Tax=Tetracentron sinense TaxID=13715 RepID=A0A834YVF5_TETSI|nr:hypothetical protein HHK36_021599 [Tetracentron sinense]